MENLDNLINQFLQQHNLTLDDLYNYIVARKKRERMIPLTKKNIDQLKPGMYWYDDDTVSETFYSDRKLKSMVLAIYDDHIIGDTFFQKNQMIDYNWAMDEIESYENDYIAKGNAHKATLRDLELVLQHKDTINTALKAIEKPLWRFSYWTDSVNKFEEDCPYIREKKWHYIVFMPEHLMFPGHYCRTAPHSETANVRPLLKFNLH